MMDQRLKSHDRQMSKPEMVSEMDLEANEDPLIDLSSHKVHEDEEDEEGAGVDYRRLFKG